MSVFSKLLFAILGLSVLTPLFLSAQIMEQTGEYGGQYPIRMNDALHPCITPEQYAEMEAKVAENIKQLKSDHSPVRKTTAATFNWPLQAVGISDCGYHIIYNYVDQDPTAGGIKDYNCGTATYDGHRGTDICTAPYPFYKMDHNQVNVIAAAPGTIIQKSDGFRDRNCAMSSDTANYIIIQHADGSCALYWHMKKSSLTSKTVGMTVATGEFLGVVGSSGSSTAPHLHFEVWSSTVSSSLKDPWSGTCNLLNPSSWWVAQKPYTEPAVIKVQVNNVPAVLPGCDTTETPNEDSCFAPGGSARFYSFLRNETPGMTVNYYILRPDNSSYASWIHNSSTSYFGSYYYIIRTLPSVPGIYTFKAVYNGLTCTKTFMVSCGTLGIKDDRMDVGFNVYPNPADNTITVSAASVENGTYSFSLLNMLGQVVIAETVNVENNTISKSLLTNNLPDGIYALRIQSGKTKVIQKVLVRHF